MRLVSCLAAALACASPARAQCGGPFPAFIDGLKSDAIAAGHDPATVDTFLAGIAPDPKVLRADRAQGVFQMPFVDFSHRLISQGRIDRGRANAVKYADLFDRIEADPGVARGVLLALTRKALADLADETLKQRIVAHAASRVRDLAERLRDAAGDDRQAVVVTRDPLPVTQQAQLRDRLAAVLPGCSLRFQTRAEKSPGINLRLGGPQAAWTLDSYLDGLDATLDDLVGRPPGKRPPCRWGWASAN